MISPMLCASGTRKLESLDGNYFLEPKLDGERLIALCLDKRLTLLTRRGNNVTNRFPEVVKALEGHVLRHKTFVLDGELTVLGGFTALLRRNTDDRTHIEILSSQLPATYHVFDLLRLEGEDFKSLPLFERRSKLERFMWSQYGTVRRIKTLDGYAPEVFRKAVEEGYEGIVAKRKDSPYEERRSRSWIKFKKSETMDAFVIGATASDAGSLFGALVLMADGKYLGKVGSGFTRKERERIWYLLSARCTDRQYAHIPSEVRKEMTLECHPVPIEVRMQETIDGSPRHPVFVRMRA
ncbi:MAG: ATP-dependent DNA ligase [Candidatus Thermoplasmatota archaeon]|nr:ATP-dependent DNA ligase [Candidatus Thermoplasmatota archaeon]